MHWQTLEAGNALAPGGRIFVVEGRSPGYLGIDTLFSQLAADYDLTPRECEIIGLSLRGLSTAAIAKRLAIGAGTVRNHKHRLYAKLDVTSEREIASLDLRQDLQPGGQPRLRRAAPGNGVCCHHCQALRPDA